MLPGFDVESIELHTERSPDELWKHKLSNAVNTLALFSFAFFAVMSTTVLSFLKEYTNVVDIVCIALVIPSGLFIIIFRSSHKMMMAVGMIYLYICGTIHIIMIDAVGYAKAYYLVCLIFSFQAFGVRIRVGTWFVCLFTFGLMGCGVSPFSPSFTCVIEQPPNLLLHHLIQIFILSTVTLANLHTFAVKAEQGLRHEKQLSAALTQKSNDLAIALAQEQEINQIRSNLIHVISHEFRTPMTVIKLSNSMLERNYEHLTVEKKQQYHGQVEENLGRLSELIDIVLQSKPETTNELNTLIEQVKGESWAT